jgi:hypothetical protein
MKLAIAKKFKCKWKEMNLKRLRTNEIIGDGDNGRSIGDMRF